ncbi:magnesium/cobalt transporter CorA [Pedobacter sp. SL55]|uniref:magnesium/cobalt transporter CorA n=1 Tax=Pedobacter sp. SL55 TaxID=2995161 RepID=UPI0022707A80|nr:magnesium/cobalt transporter CorA [Pedobacter sp. SL55]WAC40241.1 magnesium/cobalt transporter CorA [Pedobacter sp. SL55]
MAKPISFKQKKKKYALPPPGTTPGFVYIDSNSLKPKINLYSYNAVEFKVEKLTSLSNITEQTKNRDTFYWVDIKGLNSAELFNVFSEELKIHKLVLEDITRTYHRPKFEDYEDYNFAVSRMLSIKEDASLENEQVSFIQTKNVLYTFQESYEDCLDAVRNRLKEGKGNIRIGGTGYLMYALMDMIVDSYFAILSNWNEDMDEIEDRLLSRPDKSVMYETQLVKRNLIAMRRVVWPERDKMNDILRTDSNLISEQTKMFIKDAYDHTIQLMDMVESMKEIASSNIDMYLSIISNRMNEIMKVLTIISSIFIPLTFIAGIYGMNFAKQDPITGKFMPSNMPELYQPHGYEYTMLVMVLIALVQIIFFWRKGWFK